MFDIDCHKNLKSHKLRHLVTCWNPSRHYLNVYREWWRQIKIAQKAYTPREIRIAYFLNSRHRISCCFLLIQIHDRFLIWSRYSSVTIVTWLRTTLPGNWGSITGRCRDFLFHSNENNSSTHPTSYARGTGGGTPSPRVNIWSQADHSFVSSDGVKNAWSYTPFAHTSSWRCD
jgi:hypothetical protein